MIMFWGFEVLRYLRFKPYFICGKAKILDMKAHFCYSFRWVFWMLAAVPPVNNSYLVLCRAYNRVMGLSSGFMGLKTKHQLSFEFLELQNLKYEVRAEMNQDFSE